MAAYYNEHDPYAAQWIRNLIAAGHVAPGEVDERDIRDVHPDDLRGFTQCHFFAGIAVWSHALRSAGWEDDRPVWTGSCPCQPFSAAGRRGGTADERHLWPHWFHLIAECRPPAVLGEQVASKDGLAWFDLVQADLEGAGYAVGASDLCAAGFSGAHIRQRLYFVGFEGVADSINRRRAWSSGQSCSQELGAAELRRIGGLADASGERHHGQHALLRQEASGRLPARISETSGGCASGGLADGSGTGPLPAAYPGLHCCEEGPGPRHGEPERFGDACGLADANGEDCGRRGIQGPRESAGKGVGSTCERPSGLCASGGLANADCRERAGFATGEGSQHYRSPAGRFKGNGELESGSFIDSMVGAARYDDPGRNWPHAPMLGRHAVDWLFCRDGKWRPVGPGTFPLVDETPARVGRLRAYGNALDAETAAEFVAAAIRATADYQLLLDESATVT